VIGCILLLLLTMLAVAHVIKPSAWLPPVVNAGLSPASSGTATVAAMRAVAPSQASPDSESVASAQDAPPAAAEKLSAAPSVAPVSGTAHGTKPATVWRAATAENPRLQPDAACDSYGATASHADGKVDLPVKPNIGKTGAGCLSSDLALPATDPLAGSDATTGSGVASSVPEDSSAQEETSQTGSVLGAQALSALPIRLAAVSAPTVATTHPYLLLDATTLAALRQRATANTAEWTQLKAACDTYIGGTVNYPTGAPYPDPPNLGQGYEGDVYFPVLMNEAMCYQALRLSNPTAAATYGAKAVDILMKMSTPFTTGSGNQGEDPLTDDGYVIRYYGVGFGLAYDWLYDLLTPAQRTQVYTTANAWLTAFEDPNGKAAYAYAHPQSNYYAGYFHAKAVIALGTYTDNPSAATEWADWYSNQFTQRVQPYYALHLLGGGWPEGFGNYGPKGVLNMSMPMREVKTATGQDLIHVAAAPYSYPLDSADYAMHFTWPSRAYFDDRDTNHEVSTTQPAGTTQTGMFVQILGALNYWGSTKATVFHQYLNEVNAATSNYGSADPWLLFLDTDPSVGTTPVNTLPLSYLALGMNSVAARSDWTTSASWMSFRAGPYVNNPDQAEEGFDQGSLALARGAVPLLVNTYGWMVHNPNGSSDETLLYNDLFSDLDGTVFHGNRQIYNIFYVRHMSGSSVAERYGQGTFNTEDGQVRTQVSAFEDGSDYVYVLATHLEDMYRPFSAGAGVAAWSRQIVYLRPNRFVVYDRTTSGSTSYDQYMAWHFPASPVAGTAASGQNRLDVTYNGTYAGAMTTVLPASTTTTTVSLYPTSNPVKVWQVQVRPPNTNVSQQWLTVFDMSSTASAVAAISPVTITQGAVLGVRLAASDGNSVVISSSGAAGTPVAGTIAYTVPVAVSQHVITDLTAATGYNITVSTSGSTQAITVSSGGTYMSSAKGVLDFYVNAGGTVQQGKPIISTLPISSLPVSGTPRASNP
jgi:hypothetical protein